MRTRPPAEASRRDEDGAAGEGVTEGQQSRTSVQPSCCDDEQGVGIGTGAPLGAEPAGDFAEDHAGPQGTLAVVVGGGDIAAGDEDKEIAAAFTDAAGELLAALGGGADGEQPVEPAVEVGTVLDQGGVLQPWAPLADGGGAAQELLEARCETGVSGVDGVLGIAQQMGKAKLAFVAMPGLCRITVGNPDIGLGLA